MLALAVMISLEPPCDVLAGERGEDLSKTEDEMVLTVETGIDEGELGYSDTMMGGGSGPEAFTVTDPEALTSQVQEYEEIQYGALYSLPTHWVPVGYDTGHDIGITYNVLIDYKNQPDIHLTYSHNVN